VNNLLRQFNLEPPTQIHAREDIKIHVVPKYRCIGRELKEKLVKI